jgi:hypothetical protein
MQASEMNLDQCHAWLRANGVELTSDPLLVMSLDAAAAAMPEGWWFWINHCALNNRETFVCRAVSKRRQWIEVETEADTELLARFRLAVACRMATKGATNAH